MGGSFSSSSYIESARCLSVLSHHDVGRETGLPMRPRWLDGRIDWDSFFIVKGVSLLQKPIHVTPLLA